MKYLCPTDFSKCSLNAINWILNFSKNQTGVKIHVLHCIDNPGTLYQELVELKKEKAISFLDNYTKELKKKFENITVSYSIVLSNPKKIIIEKANELIPDFIILGSFGLSNVKDITLGSVTEYVVDHCEFPVLCIPNNTIFTNLNAVLLGVDDKEIKHPETINNFLKMITHFNPKLFLVQIKSNMKELGLEFDQRIEEFIEDLEIEPITLERNINISHTLNEFAGLNDVKLICFIHRKKNWFRNMFHNSTTRDGLFDLEHPFLVIPE